MAPRVVAVNLVFGTFVRIVASASAQNVFAHATSMLVCHRCRQLGPLTTNLNRGPMSRLLFLGASYRACCRPAFPNALVLCSCYQEKTNTWTSETNDSLLPTFSFPSSPSPSLSVSCLPPDLIVDIWRSDEFDCDFDFVAHKIMSGIMLSLYCLPSPGTPSSLLSSFVPNYPPLLLGPTPRFFRNTTFPSSLPIADISTTDDFDCDCDFDPLLEFADGWGASRLWRQWRCCGACRCLIPQHLSLLCLWSCETKCVDYLARRSICPSVYHG